MRLFRRTPLGGSFALAGIAALAFASGTPVKAQSAGDSREISPDLQAILAEARFGRKVSASAKLPVQVGFARGGTALYITPEVGVNAPPGSDLYNTALSVAKGFNANFIPTHFASLPNTTASFTALPANTPVRDIYVFTTQGNVLSAAPTPAGPSDTNANYSPLWQVSLVAWNSGITPTTLTSTQAIETAVQAGQITVTKTPIIVECSVIFSAPPGGELPGSTAVIAAPSFAKGGATTSEVDLPLQIGFFNHEPALYITPEVGVNPASSFVSLAQTVADGFNSNFVPQAFTSLPGSNVVDDIYVFTNSTQGNVLASAPVPAGPSNAASAYSPLWQVNLVSWNSGKTPRPLTSEADILNARSAGEVTIVPGATTGITVECSVIFTPQGGLLPGAKIALSRTRNQDEG